MALKPRFVTVEQLIAYADGRRNSYAQARRLMAAGWISGTGEVTSDGYAVIRCFHELQIGSLSPTTKREIRAGSLSPLAELALVRLGWRKNGEWTWLGTRAIEFLQFCK